MISVAVGVEGGFLVVVHEVQRELVRADRGQFAEPGDMRGRGAE